MRTKKAAEDDEAPIVEVVNLTPWQIFQKERSKHGINNTTSIVNFLLHYTDLDCCGIFVFCRQPWFFSIQ